MKFIKNSFFYIHKLNHNNYKIKPDSFKKYKKVDSLNNRLKVPFLKYYQKQRRDFRIKNMFMNFS